MTERAKTFLLLSMIGVIVSAPCLVPTLWYAVTGQHQTARAFLIATVACLLLFAGSMALFGRSGSFEVAGFLTLAIAINCLILIPVFVKLHTRRQQQMHKAQPTIQGRLQKR